MTIRTRDFGEIEISEENIITFNDGLFGFEETKEYVLIRPLGEDKYPVWLQSISNRAPCFILYNPFEIHPSYDPKFTGLANLADNKDNLVLALAVIKDDLQKSTVNLKCPIVINTRSKIAAQYILEQDYSMQHPLFA